MAKKSEKKVVAKKVAPKKTSAKKVTVKKVETKKVEKPVIKKDEIKLKKIGNKTIVTINNKPYQKILTVDEEKSVKNKALLYNKNNNEQLKSDILLIVDTIAVAIEKKVTEEKGLKKIIKKDSKKSVKSKKEESKDLVTQVETEFKEGNFTEDDIARLEALLKKKKEAKAIEVAPEVKQQDTGGSGGRERNRG